MKTNHTGFPGQTTVAIKPYTTKELAFLYQVSRPTVRNWLKPHEAAIGKKIGRIYSVRQVLVIFDKLGMPPDE